MVLGYLKREIDNASTYKYMYSTCTSGERIWNFNNYSRTCPINFPYLYM